MKHAIKRKKTQNIVNLMTVLLLFFNSGMGVLAEGVEESASSKDTTVVSQEIEDPLANLEMEPAEGIPENKENEEPRIEETEETPTEEPAAYDHQPENKDDVAAAIQVYSESAASAYQTRDADALAAVSTKKPRWQEKIDKDWFPEHYKSKHISAEDAGDFGNGYYTFDVKYDKQPESKKDVSKLKEKVYWETEPDAQFIPKGWKVSFTNLGEDPEFAAPYYSAEKVFELSGDVPETEWDGESSDVEYFLDTSETTLDPKKGTRENPYIIDTAAKLKGLADLVNGTAKDAGGAAIPADDFGGKTIELAVDINLANEPWTPIGYSNIELTINHTSTNGPKSGSEYRPFKGTFSGNDHIISNVSITTSDTSNASSTMTPWKNDYKGLFGVIEDATINNIKIDSVKIAPTTGSLTSKGGSAWGSLVGYASGKVTITESSVSTTTVEGNSGTGNSKGNFGLGGLLGVYDVEQAAAEGANDLIVTDTTVSGATVKTGSAKVNPGSGNSSNETITGISSYVGMVRSFLSTAADTNLNVEFTSNVEEKFSQGTINMGTAGTYGAGGLIGAAYLVRSNKNTIKLDGLDVTANIDMSAASHGKGGAIGIVDFYESSNSQLDILAPKIETNITQNAAQANSNLGGVIGRLTSTGNTNALNVTAKTDNAGNTIRGQLTGTITGEGASRGGIVGNVGNYGSGNKTTISELDVTTALDGNTNGNNVAGVIGLYDVSKNGENSELDVSKVNVTTNIKGEINLGGIIGHLNQHGAGNNNNKATLSNNTFTGNIDGLRLIGGMVGHYYTGTDAKNNIVSINNATTSGKYYGSTGNAHDIWVPNNSSSTNVEMIGVSAGGLVGRIGNTRSENNSFEISDSNSSANISSRTQLAYDGMYLGGAVGGYTVFKGKENKLNVKNVSVSGNVEGLLRLGGFIGTVWMLNSEASEAHFENTHATGSAKGSSYDVAGFVGFVGLDSVANSTANPGNIKTKISIVDSSATGDATSTGSFNVGGFIGKIMDANATDTEVLIKNSTAKGNVDGHSFNVGGFIGHLEPRTGTKNGKYMFKNNTASGNVKSGSYNVGGFVGHDDNGDEGGANNNTVEYLNSWATGNVQGGSYNVGGFAGHTITFNENNVSNFRNTYATGDVWSPSYNSGGFAGHIQVTESTTSQINVDNSYATGNARGGAQWDEFSYGTGGFAGAINGNVVVNNSYAVGSAFSTSGNVGSFSGGTRGNKGANTVTAGVPVIKNSFGSGTVKGADDVGGFVGIDAKVGSSPTANYHNNFFDVTTTTMKTGIGDTDVSGVEGVKTKDMLETDTFTDWDILNVSHVSTSNNQQGDESPWYIDEKATYPYLYYQADGFDTTGDGKGDGYLDPQKTIETNFETTNYFLGYLEASPAGASSYYVPLRYDFQIRKGTSDGNAIVKGMTVGADRLYYPYAYGTTTTNYTTQQFWFEDNKRNDDTDGKDYVTAPRASGNVTTSFKKDQLISVGTYSQTNIVAFANGPYADKTNDSKTWSLDNEDNYTWSGEKITYRINVTNYHTNGDWKNVTVTDNLAKGVSLVNDFVFLYTGEAAVPNPGDKPWGSSRPAGITETKVPHKSKVGNAESDLHYTYDKATGKIEIHNLPDVTYAQVGPGIGFKRDGYAIEFVGQVEDGAITPDNNLPESNLEILTDANYKYDNIRNKGTATGDLHLWDPELLFTTNELGETTNTVPPGQKVPLKDEGNEVIITDYLLQLDDKDKDPVYDAYTIRYSNNHRAVVESATDFIQDKDYLLTDYTKRQHHVLPNDDYNTNPHERIDFTGFDSPNKYFRFDGWFFFKEEAETAPARNSAKEYNERATFTDEPEKFGDVVYVDLKDITKEKVVSKTGYILDPATTAYLRDRDVTLFARWAVQGPTFEFTKQHFKEGTDSKETLPNDPGLSKNVQFKLYYWTGTGEPPADAYIDPDNPGDWELRDEHYFLYTNGDGTYKLGFPEDGYYQLVETETREGYYLPENQWRFKATVANATAEPPVEDKLEGPITIKKDKAQTVIDFEVPNGTLAGGNMGGGGSTGMDGEDPDDPVRPGEGSDAKAKHTLMNYRLTDLDFLKISSAGFDSDKPKEMELKDAEFKIFKWIGENQPGETDLVNVTTPGANWVEVSSNTSGSTAGKTDGYVLLNNLVEEPNAIYQLVETKAPRYYVTPTGQWRLKLNSLGQVDTSEGGIVAIAGEDQQKPPAFKKETEGTWSGKLVLFNLTENGLPQMGGLGRPNIWLYLLIGLMIVLAGLAVGKYNQKKKAV